MLDFKATFKELQPSCFHVQLPLSAHNLHMNASYFSHDLGPRDASCCCTLVRIRHAIMPLFCVILQTAHAIEPLSRALLRRVLALARCCALCSRTPAPRTHGIARATPIFSRGLVQFAGRCVQRLVLKQDFYLKGRGQEGAEAGVL